MSERIKGLSIPLELETIKVERGLTGLKDRLKTVNAEMKHNMSAFDRSDRSIGKYETRLAGLNKKLEVQAKITEESEKKYRDMVQQHGEGSKQAEKAAQEYNKQSAELKNLQSYTEDVRKELKKLKEEQRIANSGWTKTGKKLDETGKKLTKVGDGMQSFGKKWTAGLAIVGGAVAGLGVSLFALTDKATQAADAIAKGSERAGVSTDFYQEMTFWASQNGLAHEQMEKGIGRLNQRLGMAVQGNKKYAGALERLGIDIDAVKEGTLSTEDAFAQSISSLSKMTNEQEKAELATEMFGVKLARDLLPALNEGSLSIEDAKKQAAELGLVMSEDQLYAAEAFQDSWDKIKRSLAAAGMQIGLDLMPKFQEMLTFILAQMPKIRQIIGDAFDQVMEKISATVKWWRELSGGAKTWIKIAAGVVVALGPLAYVFGTVAKVLGPLTSVLGKVFMWVGKVGGLMPALKIAFTALTGPVGLTVAAVSLLAVGIVTLYKKSESFRGIIQKVKDSFVDMYQRIKEFLTTNPKFLSFIQSVKDGFSSVRKIIINALGGALKFAMQKIGELKAYWDSDGQQLLQAFRNIFTGIWKVVEPIIKALVAIFKASFPVLKGIVSVAFKLILVIVKSVIGNIKGVIDGGLKVILGIGKIFTGLFTGDFKKMWEGVKQLFLGAIQFIWNFVQLTFFGKLLKGVAIFAKGFAGFFSSMLTGIRSTFSTVIKWIVDFVKNRFLFMKNTVSSISTGIKNLFSQVWNFIWTRIIMPVVRGIVDFVGGRFTAMRNIIKGIFTGVRDLARSLFNQTKDRIITPVKNAVSSVKSRFSDLKSKTTGIFKDLKSNVSGYVSDMVAKVKGMPKKMGDGLKKTAGNISDGLKAVANKMTSALGKGVNGVIGGVNWVLDKVGVSSKISEWSVPQYAQGTGGHPGGPAIVGDGKGRNAGQELIETPDGKQYLSPVKDTLVNLPKGTLVLSALQTKEWMKNVPKYAFGNMAGKWVSGLFQKGKKAYNKGKDIATSVGKTVKDKALNVWDYVSNPSKLLNLALEKLGVEKPNMPGILKGVGTGAFSKVKDVAIDYVKSKIDGFGAGFNGGNFTGNIKQWIMQAIGLSGVPQSWAGPLATIAQKESGGNPKAINLWDINAMRGIPSKGLMQTIDPTFNAYKGKGLNDIWNPVHNAVAAINYIKSRYGNVFNVPGIRSMRNGGAYRGYATGGRIQKDGLYRLAEEGWPEWVIPTDPSRRSDAQKLLALAGKEIQGNKRPTQLSSPSPQPAGEGGRDPVDALGEKMEKVYTLMIEMLGIQRDQLDALLVGHIIYTDGRATARALKPHLERLKGQKEEVRRG